jgi:lipid II:glycine glycyltransferase (peptidoglycan interpeptide bridge formation enzyme)
MNGINEGVPAADFDERQMARGAHFLQSRAWAAFLAAQGQRVLWAEGDGWSWMGSLRQGRGGAYIYTPYGPTAGSRAELGQALASLKAAASALGAIFVRVEPVGVALVVGDLKRTANVQPGHSWALDLTKSEEVLRSELNSSHRNVINGAERRGLSFRFRTDEAGLNEFLAALQETKKHRGFAGYPDDYYRTMIATMAPLGAARICLAEAEGEVVGASIVFDGYGTRYYAHTGLKEASRRLRAAAPLVWFLAMDAREQGLRRFDFWGVAPPNAGKDHPWAGFTEFKQSFGGEPVDYAGTWELPVDGLKYGVYRLARKFLG